MAKILTLITLLAVATPAFAQAPGAPGNLANTVSGTTVTLTWTAPTGAVTGYLVEASVVPCRTTGRITPRRRHLADRAERADGHLFRARARA